MPDLEGLSYREAQVELASVGLRWRFMGNDRIFHQPPPEGMWSTSDDDHVVEQDPQPGDHVDIGSVVALRTSCTLEPLPPGTTCID